MKVTKINDKIPVEEQENEVQRGCSDDCLVYRANTKTEVKLLTSQGINAIDPSDKDIEAGQKAAQALGISYCYGEHTPKTSIYL